MTFFKILLVIHVIGGTIGLIAGTYIMMAKKGDEIHKLNGTIFSISMLGSGMCSLVLATIHRNDFLFAVGIFTIYMVGTGWRYLYLKDIANGQQPKIIDWGLMIFMLLGSILFIYLGIFNALNKEYFGVIILVFAWRGISFAVQDYRTYKGNLKSKNYWLTYHLQRMTGAYIASLTAFAVVNGSAQLSFLPWLLPTFIFVPLIIKWSRKYRVN